MAEEVETPRGLLGLPDIAHAAIAGFCGQKGHLMLMSTSSAAMGTFGACMKSISIASRFREQKQPALGLLRRLPNLRRLCCNKRSANFLVQAIVDEGWGGRLEELESTDIHKSAALGAAIGTGNLPSLQRIAVYSGRGGDRLTELSNGLRGGASPRLTDVACVCDYEGMVAFAEALEARMALGCCPITRLSLDFTDHYDGDVDPGAIRRVCSSRALANLKALELGGCYQEEEVAAMAEALRQLKPQEVTEISLDGWWWSGFGSPGRIFACLTPAVMPSVHTVRLSHFDTRSAACMEQLNAAVREGALVNMEVLDGSYVELNPLFCAVARSHGCPKLHTLKINHTTSMKVSPYPEEPLVLKLAEGAFPNLRALTIAGNRFPYLEGLVGSLEGGAQCCKTLQSVSLHIEPDDDTVHLPRLGKVLAGLLGLEHVKVWGDLPDEGPTWRVEGGREALLELTGVIGGLDSDNLEQLQSRILGVLEDLYTER